jgi:hypothetical protein
LFEDNIITDVFPCIEVDAGCSGNAFSYNLIENTPVNGIIYFAVDTNHNPHNCFNLYEGNIAPNLICDGYYGSSSEDTIFRNWLTGSCKDSSVTIANSSDPYTLSLKRFTRNYVIAGNILGKSGVYPGVISYGLPNIGNVSFTGTCQPTKGTFWSDWEATAKLVNRVSNTAGVIALNSGSASAGNYSTIAWNASGWTDDGVDSQTFMVASMTGSNASWTGGSAGEGGGSSEALPPQGTTVNVFAQQSGYQEEDLDVQASTTEVGNYSFGPGGAAGGVSGLGSYSLVPSMEYQGRPSWFNSLRWPPFDPKSVNVISYNSIPAGYRYMNNGQDPPTGGPTPPSGFQQTGQ